MASKSNKRKTGTAKRKTNTSKKRTSRSNSSQGIRPDVLVLVLFALSVILFISNFNLAGGAGNFLGNFTKGLFGVMSYVFPIVLFYGVLRYVVNKTDHRIIRKTVGLILTFIFLCAIFQLFLAGVDSNDTIGSFYSAAADGYIAGGLLGGLVIFIFSKPFGTAGAYILTIIGLIISIIVLTQKPLVRKFHKLSTSAVLNANAKRREKREELLAAREEHRRYEEEMMEKRRLEEELLSKKSPSKPKPAKTTPAKTAASPVKFDGASIDYKSIFNKDKIKEVDKRNAEDLPNDISYLEEAENSLAKTAKKSILAKTENTSKPATDLPVIEEPEIQEPVIHINGLDNENRSKVSDFDSIKEIHDVTELRFDDNLDIVEEPVKESSSLPTAEDIKKAGTKDVSAKANAKEAAASKENKAENVDNEINKNIQVEVPPYKLPGASLLTKMNVSGGDSREYLLETAEKLRQTLQDFGVNVKITNVSRGPAVTRYELEPEHGVKVSKIVSLTDDIKLNLAAADIRMEAPIPGKAAIGIEVPNKENILVPFRGMIESSEYKNAKSKLSFAVGHDIEGKPIVTDIAKMPHLLIAGATGSGKSVCINTLIMSILFKAKPEEVRMIMIDPKVIELSIYNGIPHLLLPVVTDPKKAAGALNWAVKEMTDRYQKFANYVGIRDLTGYNAHINKLKKDLTLSDEEKAELKVLPQIVVIVDELADLMMVAPGEVEQSICRLTQLARAAGIHLVVATQRPSVNVITGLIKANMPSRIAFAVTSGVDSRTILDMNGAERLLGKGDMLFYPQGYPKPVRVQGALVPDEDVARVVEYINNQNGETNYDEQVEKEINDSASSVSDGGGISGADSNDEYFWEAGSIIIDKDKASIGMLQRALKIGFNRAARIMDQLCEAGVVGPEEGTKPRQILMSKEEFENMREASE